MADLHAGVLLVEMDGRIVEVEGSFVVRTSTETREAKMAHSGKVGVKRTPVAPGLTCTVQVYDDDTSAFWAAFINKDCMVKTRGRVYQLTGATTTGAFDHDLVEGTAEIEIFAQRIVEIAD